MEEKIVEVDKEKEIARFSEFLNQNLNFNYQNVVHEHTLTFSHTTFLIDPNLFSFFIESKKLKMGSDYVLDQYENLPYTLKKLSSDVIKIIEDFLDDKIVEGKKLQYEYMVDVINNSEYNSQTVRIIIKIDKPLKYIYEEIRPKIYEQIAKPIPPKLINSITVHFESM